MATSTLLWILGIALVICGVVALVRGEVLWGVVLIVLGLICAGGISLIH